MKRLKDKTAIITGGAQGIGFTTAQTFAREGANVVIWDVNATKGKQVVNAISQKDTSVMFQQVNVTDYDSVSVAAKLAIEKHGSLDILINNAGITRDARLIKMTPEQWQQVIDVNLTGVFNCTKAVSQYMIEKESGRILNAASVVGLYGNFGQTNYVATKSGVIGMTKVWAKELGRKGITVNAVAPGFIATEMIDTIPEKIVNKIKEATPLARLGTSQDIANAYLFLASDDAGFINGAVLSVDGGVTI